MVLLIGLLLLFGAFSPGLSFYENQPKLLTIDGNLIIESGLNKNITFRTSGSGAVLLNNVNLMRPQTVNNGSAFLGSYNLMRRLSTISTTINAPRTGILARLRAVENRPNNETQSNTRFRRLQRRVVVLEGKLSTLMDKITEDNCRSNPCQNGGVCSDLFDGFLCLCPKNWEGVTCSQDVDECRNFAGTDLGCQNGATCRNSPGSYNCFCANGYQGIHCTRKSLDCMNSAPGELCGRGTCVPSNEGLGYKCLCEQGWTTNGVTPACTEDVDECRSMKPHCSMDPVVQCINTRGSFQCGSCPPGYTGNGFYCTDLDECQFNNGGCSLSPFVTCFNTRGSHSCGNCPPGYSGDGRICTVGGEGLCSRANICHSLARCQEIGSAVNCYCPTGYTGNGIGPHGCVAFESNICSPNPCHNGGSCISHGLTFSCSCRPGYNPPFCSDNPCSPNPCMNGGTCIAKDGNFTCSCKNNFDGALCQNEASSCSGVLQRANGTLKYPTTQGSYIPNARCTWLIRTDLNKVLNVTFKNFTLEHSNECRFDFLQINDGRSSAAHLIGRFCGNDPPLGGHFISTRNTLYLWFRSDNTLSYSGFELEWVSIDPICGATINATTFGTINSPGSPGHYPPNRDCWWYIRAPPGKRIQFHFFSLKLEFHATCSYDYLSVHDGAQQDSPLIVKYCNSSNPDPLTTPSNEVTLHFRSDEDATDTGFQIHYTVVAGFPGCGGTFTAISGEFGSPMQDGSYSNLLDCEYLIKMPLGSRIDLEFKQFVLEDSSDCKFDYIAMYEGSSENDPLVYKVCGSTIPLPYKSLSNVLLLKFRTDWSNTMDGFRVSYKTVCGGTFESESGTITSPMYPQPYQSDRKCTYEIIAPMGNAINLDWIDFDIEENTYPLCQYDYVQVFDGHDYDNSTEIGKYCGAHVPPKVVSSQNMLTLKLVTDPSVSGRGFKANYSFFDTGCGGILKKPDLIIKPPEDTEGYYAHNQNCTWVIVAPLTSVIQLTFSAMDIEHYEDCFYDYVAIYDGVRNKEVGRFCGNVIPPPITSSGNILKINFVSDESLAMQGFSFTYSFHDAKSLCGGNYLTPSGTIKSPNYPEDYPELRNCEWTITVANGQQIQLTVDTFEIEDSDCRYDYLEIRNGGTNSSSLFGTYCGTNIPKTFKSFTNQVYLRFVTDSTRPGKGFLIDWMSSSTGCGGTLTSHKGSISSPNFPLPYGDNGFCVWHIIVNQGSTISVKLEEMDIESEEDCNYDYLEVLDGRDLSSAKSLKKLCHTQTDLAPITTSSNAALVRFRTDVSDTRKGFLLSYTTNCTQTIDGVLSGAIESPNFPNPYPHNLVCKWKIVVPKGNRISYEFSHFQLESFALHDTNRCDYDYLEVVQTNQENVINTKKYCDEKPLATTTATDTLIMNFVTDVSTAKSGFRMEWQIEGCGGTFKGRPSGEIMSPNYPKAYPRDTECLWTIEVDIGSSIELNITDFDFPTRNNCENEGLTVVAELHVIASFCESISKSQIVYSNYPIKVFFKTGDTPPRSGFSATFKAVPPRCGGLLTNNGFLLSPNYPANYERNTDCEWIIQVDHTHSVELEILDFDLEYSETCKHDYVKIFDGDNELLSWCNNTVPSKTVYLSTSSQIRVKFNTDSDTEAKGFKIRYGSACGSTIVTNSTGTVSTTLRKNTLQTCTWIIQSDDPARHITLSIALQDEESNLKIYEGSDTNSPAINYRPAHLYYSRGNALTLSLNTTKPVVFSAHYSVYDNFCGGTYHSFGGLISSPKYPNSYPNKADCIWELVATPGNKLSIEFSVVDMELSDDCNEDYLEVRESDGAGKVLDVLCGKIESPKRIISDGSIWMKFHSNEDDTGLGFLATYSYEKSVDLSGNEGVITTPMYPETFHKQDTLSWRITVPYGKVIQLTFTDFKFYHNDDGTCSSVLTIFDAYNEDGATALEDACGASNLEAITSTSNVIFLKARMHLTESKLRIEWKAIDKSFETIQIENKDCGPEFVFLNKTDFAKLFSSVGYPNGYKENLNCSYIIQSQDPVYHPKYHVVRIDLEDSADCNADSLTIYQSRDLSDWKEVGKICNAERQIYRGNPYLKLSFKTDYYTNRTGFTGILSKECGGLLTESSGVIQMQPSRTNLFEMTVPCDWEINVRRGRKIQIEVEEFNVYNSVNCNTYLLFKNGPNEHSPLLGEGKYCNSTKFTLPETHSNQAFVRYSYGTIPYEQVNSSALLLVLKYHEVAKECGDDIVLSLSNNSTIIHSPNYPKIPDPHTECTWTITTTNGEALQVEFVDRFDLTPLKDCEKEYVEVREGGTKLSQVVGKYCNQKPTVLYSSSNILKVTYFTDVSDPKNGFKAKISLAMCGASFVKDEGMISSPGYPHPGSYAAYSACEYRIIGTASKALNITFLDVSFPTGENGSCSSDYVEVLSVIANDENNTRTEETLGKYCYEVPDSILAESNEVLIRYRSSHSDSSSLGFRLTFNSSSVSCGGSLNSESGIITSPGYTRNRITKQFCEWKVTVPKGRKIKIELLDVDLSRTKSFASQSLWFFNDFKQHNRITIVRGNATIQPFYSSDNIIVVKFVARISSNNRGFKLKYSSDEISVCGGDIDQRSGILESPENLTSFYCDYQRSGAPFFDNSNVGTISFRIQDSLIGRLIQCQGSPTKMEFSWPSAARPEHSFLAHVCGNVSEQTISSPFTDTRLEVRQYMFFGPVRYKVYYQVDKCGGMLEGRFSIGLPTDLGVNYGPINCAWQYKNMDTVYVELNISQVNFTKPCDSEYINIYKGPTQLSPLWKKLCGDNLNLETIRTQSNYLFVEYHSHDYNSNSTAVITGESLASGCGGVLHKNVPIIKSPGNDSYYPNEIECDWELIADPGFSIELAFINRFFVQESKNCSKDYVEIFDFSDSSWLSMGRYCGRQKPANITSTGSRIKVMFHTDESITGDGFQISWQQVCGGIFNATKEGSSIISPGFPSKYFKSMVCNYTLLGPTGKNIMVNFTHFDLESGSPKCVYDNVTIHYKSEYFMPDQLQELGSYCNRKGPAEFQYKEKIQIMFFTDNYVEKTGFKFDFRIDNCGGTVDKEGYIKTSTNSDGTYLRDQTCTWNITAPYNKFIVLRFEYFETEPSETCYTDALMVYKGNQMIDENRYAQICGNYTNLTPIKIDSSDAILQFKTDSLNEFRGFAILVLFVTNCDQSITLTSSSPTFSLNVRPSDYEELMDCHYKILAPESFNLQLNFTRFHIAYCSSTNQTDQLCTCDFLEVRDGKGPFSEMIGTYCGHELPGSIRSSRSAVYLRFVTDSRNESTGFDISLTAVPNGCGEPLINVTEKEAVIFTPGSRYPNNLKCAWTVVGPMYQTIQFRFEEFDLEAGTDETKCDKDYLEITDSVHNKYIDEGLGPEVILNGQHQTQVQFYLGIRHATASHIYCGNSLPPVYLSRSNKVYLKFSSDSEVTKSGFKIRAQELPKCIQKYTTIQGRLISNSAETCTITIEMPQNYTIAMYFNHAHFYGSDCESSGMKVYDGNATSTVLARLCGFTVPNPIFSHGNVVTLNILAKDPNNANSHGGTYDITYLATDKGRGCGGLLYSYGGAFTSPLYPENDRNNSDCRWDIVVPVNLQVALLFEVFDFGSKTTCSSNYLVVLERQPEGGERELTRHCGTDIPSKLVSTKNSLSVRMVKTVNFAGSGFKILFMGIHPGANITSY